MQGTPLPFLGQEEPLEKGEATHSSILGLPCGSAGKESACNARDLDSISGLRRSPGERKGYPHQYPGLENSMDCIVHWVAKSRTRLSDFHFNFPRPRAWRRIPRADASLNSESFCSSDSKSHLPLIFLFIE